jgi:hypothetical protein
MKAETLALSALEAFARHAIGAGHYPGDVHPCTVAECERCGVAPLELTVEHDEGDRSCDFRGVVWMRCTQCGAQRVLLAVTASPEREPLVQIERPACVCGATAFYVVLCERLEVWDGVPSFFDEGVMAGQCAGCGRLRAIGIHGLTWPEPGRYTAWAERCRTHRHH